MPLIAAPAVTISAVSAVAVTSAVSSCSSSPSSPGSSEGEGGGGRGSHCKGTSVPVPVPVPVGEQAAGDEGMDLQQQQRGQALVPQSFGYVVLVVASFGQPLGQGQMVQAENSLTAAAAASRGSE
eukprot:CAMPEP_0175107354 /NCGR_PEP_ID=MMETSP0086_2-20121207/11839_1 /TAXON_ID=136419 /ORGANISM="Unknown Unknown, Strain D1" /LENGTH=124 /DNA_ID=CAMNT_0016384053 /DNA_START=207 /DNA_END=581 /DNA_ORIENTATION=-